MAMSSHMIIQASSDNSMGADMPTDVPDDWALQWSNFKAN